MKKETLAILGGVIVGAAVGYYLNSDKGRKVREKAAKKANDYGNAVAVTATSAIDSAKSSLQHVKENAKSYFASTIDEASQEIQKGANTAKAEINKVKNNAFA